MVTTVFFVASASTSDPKVSGSCHGNTVEPEPLNLPFPVCSPDASEYVYAVRMRAVSKIRWKFFCSFETA
jgi:hypothetical protein